MFLRNRRRLHLATVLHFPALDFLRFPINSSAVILHASSQLTPALSFPRRQMKVWRAPGIKAPGPNDPPEYVPLEGTEDPSKYRPRGYHPISMGDVVADKYTIVHKLGYGGWSTIWLARDAMLGRYVAIKIALADSGSREVETLRELNSPSAATIAATHRGQSAIPGVLDDFTIRGPNGTHNAIVTRPTMVSVAKAKDGSDLRVFQLPVARAIAAQLAQAVAYVHSREIVHGGTSILACKPPFELLLIRIRGRPPHWQYPSPPRHHTRFPFPRATIQTIRKARSPTGSVS